MYICVYTCCLTNYIIQLPRYLNLPDARCPNGSRYRSNRVHSILGLTIVMVIDTIWLAWQPFIYLSNASKCFQTHQGELANSWTDFIMAIHHYHARELCCNAVCFCFSSLFHQNASHFAIGRKDSVHGIAGYVIGMCAALGCRPGQSQVLIEVIFKSQREQKLSSAMMWCVILSYTT